MQRQQSRSSVSVWLYERLALLEQQIKAQQELHHKEIANLRTRYLLLLLLLLLLLMLQLLLQLLLLLRLLLLLLPLLLLLLLF